MQITPKRLLADEDVLAGDCPIIPPLGSPLLQSYELKRASAKIQPTCDSNGIFIRRHSY